MPQAPNASLVIVADVGGEHFHVGDEAMLEANVEVLRRHNCAVQITVIGRGSGVDEERRCREVLADASGLFISGGGNLCSSWPDLLNQRLLWMRETRRRRLPIVTGGQTIGPELDAGERSALAEALAEVEHLGVRELPSAALALELGVPRERLFYQADDAFFLAAHPPAEGEALGLAELDGPYLAITLDSSFGLPASRATLGKLASQLARAASELRLHPVFVPHVGPLGELGSEDGQAGIELRRLLSAEGVECSLLPVMSPAATVWVTQRASLVVSSRYHPLVFATAGAVPSIGIYRDEYTRIKLQGALAQVGMEAHCLSVTAAEYGGLLEGCRDLRERHDEIAAILRQARRRLEAQEGERWRLLRARLGWGAEPGDAAGREGSAVADDWAGRAASNGSRRTSKESTVLTEEQWIQYSRDGCLNLGRLLEPEELEVLRQRADDLAMGVVVNPDVQMQLDTGGVYEELPAAVRSFDQGTRLYRKIQGLETDEHFSRLVRHPICLEICGRQYGAHAPISIFRAMVMNKPAGQGTVLPWHQDGGAVWALDRDPLVTVWVALDPATQANGCLEVIPGTHKLGLLTTYGSTVREEDVERHCPPERVHHLEVEAGHGVLLHNWLIHRSGVNPTPGPRRALTICYMDGRTLSVLTGNPFPLVAGSLPAEPYPYVRQLQVDCANLRNDCASLNNDNANLRDALEGRWIRRGMARIARGVRARLLSSKAAS